MEDSRKKPIMIGVIIVCFAVAGLVFFTRGSGGGGGIDDIPDDRMTWVKCNNPSCKAEYEIGEKQFFKAMEERFNPNPNAGTPPLTCEKCSKDSVFQAVKCVNPSCGVVFFRVTNDFFDRCPECKQSETEEIRKIRKKQMAEGQ